MRVKILYKCEVCGVEYASKDEALKCESFHLKPKRIRNARYNGMNIALNPYPAALTVEFEDGVKMTYKR